MFPQEFENRMKDMLGSNFPEFKTSMEGETCRGLRINPLKVLRESFLNNCPFSLATVPWEENGFYYDAGDAPGAHPFHQAGVYYIQEPSAMAPAGYLEVKPGEKVLDLCAAPGGKTTQLAGALQGEGILFSNEIHPARAKILSENVERMGIKNALVLNETPEHLRECFPEYFDKILVDAPCSGEGMFRKNETALLEWSLSNVEHCAKRQDDILDCAADMLRPGGRMVYSTCTFAPEENEGSISRFLKRHPEFFIAQGKKYPGMEGGNPHWILEPALHIEDTIRLFPHRIKGEGHFAAVLIKSDTPGRGGCRIPLEKGLKEKDCKEFLEFAKENLKRIPEGGFAAFGEQLYLMPKGTPSLKGLKVLRPGLHLGTNKKNRFEPSHALALSIMPGEAARFADFPSDGPEISCYLKGQTLNFQGEKGWHLITVEGYSIGWGKLAGGILKNHYPKGLRKF
ncbi:MAG: RsmF rRNA methyltransferase first C-terminal domain-containing protein [Lachnospiraceae bacterium]|nr:RsmF rRNA methyltransferase first C-terminal domain-containing protein [Lachnospiraceae bacterium]MDE6980316.1 RsmF rRNA methyltransferase first C-terminal domain-containing protein [Lachnospiraceae bacterium]